MIIHTKGEDFFCEFTFLDETGAVTTVPDYDFTLDYYVSDDDVATASKISGEYTNCCIGADEKFYVTFDAPTWKRGRLMRRATLYVPQPEMPDGVRTIITIDDIGKVV